MRKNHIKAVGIYIYQEKYFNDSTCFTAITASFFVCLCFSVANIFKIHVHTNQAREQLCTMKLK